jgi:2-polyprenyl-3-methyl-5-hydroxy-6-metoxy-1,4-benzoquinol methylase
MAETRFEFGKNWLAYANSIDDERIALAKKSLVEKLGCSNLRGKVFLDIGCGSGLFSLAAHQLGASVMSFDYDIHAVECTKSLKSRFGLANSSWDIAQGSVLDASFMSGLTNADVVYSWGVLHHTGRMDQAIDAAMKKVKTGGQLFISIYNDQGRTSEKWTRLKKYYLEANPLMKRTICWLLCGYFWRQTFVDDILSGHLPTFSWNRYKIENRGMSAWYDIVDWAGGYPFEVAKPEVIFSQCHRSSFELTYLKTVGGGHGCNEFVFLKKSDSE